MANLGSNLTHLGSTNPKIVIIPPSPRKGSTREETETEPEPSPITVKMVSTDSDDDSKQNGDEFKNPDCEMFEEKRWTYIQDGEIAEEAKDSGTRAPEQPSEREKNVESDDVFRNITVESRLDRCKRVLASFNESKCLLIFNFLLIVIPIATGFMGAEYLAKCPLSSETAVFLIMLSIAVAIVFISRILLKFQKTLLPSLREWKAFRAAIIVGNLAIIVYIATEMYSFFWTDPSFEMGLEQYCEEIFYKYTHWTILICLVVITFLSLLLLPNCPEVALQKAKTK